MRVFVTGGTGFVGSHLVEALLETGHEVRCLVRTPEKAAALFPDRPLTLIRGDLSAPDALRRGVEGAEVVFHAAAATAAKRRAEFYDVNEHGVQRVLDAMRSAGPGLQRFVHVSTLAAAGPSRRGRAHQGGEPENPVTHYGASKLAGELRVRAASLPWTVVRPPVVYGPRDRELFRMFSLTRRGLAPVFRDGSQELSLVFVTDLIRALIAVAFAAVAVGKVYYACHPEIIRARALATAIHRVARRRPDASPVVLPIPGPVARAALWITGTAARLAGRATLLSADKANEFLADALTCSPATLERDTGWTAGYDLATGLAHTAQWYRDQGWL